MFINLGWFEATIERNTGECRTLQPRIHIRYMRTNGLRPQRINITSVSRRHADFDGSSVRRALCITHRLACRDNLAQASAGSSHLFPAYPPPVFAVGKWMVAISKIKSPFAAAAAMIPSPSQIYSTARLPSLRLGFVHIQEKVEFNWCCGEHRFHISIRAHFSCEISQKFAGMGYANRILCYILISEWECDSGDVQVKLHFRVIVDEGNLCSECSGFHFK